MQDRLRTTPTRGSTPARFEAIALSVILGASFACTGPGPDHVPAGQVALSLVWAVWDEEASAADPDRDVLALRVDLRNGVDSAPALLNPALFSVSTSGGVEVVGMPSSYLGSSPCESDLSVLAGASRECSLAFRIPPDELLLELIYRAVEQDREARAAVPACAPGLSAGLCELGRVCASGECVTPCSAQHLDGVCLDAGEVCTRSGTCEPGCSPEHPAGPCAEGTCVQGACDASVCWSASLSAGCLSCAEDRAAICEPTASRPSCHPEQQVDQCVQCPVLSDDTTCDCLDSYDACLQCTGDAGDRAWFLSYWSCLARECPECL